MLPLARSVLVVVLTSLLAMPQPARADDPPTDALEQRLDASGLPDATLAETSDPDARVEDVELSILSAPPGLGLLATPLLESGDGTQRPVCRAPCTTLLGRGAYRFVVETRRGRDRAVPGAFSLYRDGHLELSIESRLARRIGWWTATAALVGSGLAMFLSQRHALPSTDPTCTVSCFRYSSRQTALMTLGGIIVTFGAITARTAITTRDVGHVVYRPGRRHAETP